MRLTQNAIYVPEDDKYLVSSHVHDFVTHTFKDGLRYSIDGGQEYARASWEMGTAHRVEDYNLSFEKNSPEEINEKLLWGNRGKDGKSPLTYRPIKSLETDHLKAILANCPYAAPIAHNVIKHWLKERGEC